MTDAPTHASGVDTRPGRKWAITLSVMLVTVMQILDTSVVNVALPHMQGSLSASVEEVAWVLSSYLAANAVIIPATGWLAGLLGRRRFFLICTTLFTVSSFLSGIAPNLSFLVLARIFQGIGGGPLIPLSQAIMWEIFPLRQRGMAMAVWGVGVMMGPILGPTLGGWIADNWSWPWIFYMNLPIGLLGFFMASAFLFDPPYLRRPGRVDGLGLVLMVIGFGSLQLFLDRGEREDWFDSDWIVALALVAGCALAGFLIRELTTPEPILNLSVFRDRNFATGTCFIAMVGLGLYSSMLLVALYTQKLLGYDAWTAGTVLAPGGFGNMLSLVAAGRLVAHMDQRVLLGLGCVLNAVGLYFMSNLTLGVDYWNLVWPRFLQGLGLGFIFVPLTTLALATIEKDKLGNATAAYNVFRNLGGSVGVALATTLLARRSQFHQASLVNHINVWDSETRARLTGWTNHFLNRGADPFTAQRRALAMLYHDAVGQAQVLAYMDDFWLLALLFSGILLLIPFMRRVRAEPGDRAPLETSGRVEGLPAATD
ncbi:MAG: DHA2 family efflux MFS transporter permease subunit [Candidatus Rokubacteria bacterium]|nr:DHA2 family efflux MFS transporter permease subunit [Candidatus Rokubacteria bacterium]